MIWRKKYFLFLGVFGLIVAFVFGFLIIRSVYAALTCSVTTVCNSPNVVIFRMSNTTNAHAELPSQSNYSQLVCCSGVTGLGNSCSGTYAVAAKLSGTTNAHVQQNTYANYANNACISVPSGGSVSIGYQANNCTGYDTTLASSRQPPMLTLAMLTPTPPKYALRLLAIYALALASRTKLAVRDFKCAWFDEKHYFEFSPLHAVRKKELNQNNLIVK